MINPVFFSAVFGLKTFFTDKVCSRIIRFSSLIPNPSLRLCEIDIIEFGQGFSLNLYGSFVSERVQPWDTYISQTDPSTAILNSIALTDIFGQTLVQQLGQSTNLGSCRLKLNGSKWPLRSAVNFPTKLK